MLRKLIAVSILSALASTASAVQVKVTVTNNAASGGTWLTPFWVGFHNGSHDTFDVGSAASAAIESISEVGDSSGLIADFAGNGVDGGVGGMPIAPGTSASSVFNLANDGSNDYLSFAAMVLPSSDFFIGNDDPLGASVAAVLNGSSQSATFVITQAYDAGTEVNDFTTSAPPLPASGLFASLGLPASSPGAGAAENGVITVASGADFASFLNVGGADVSGLNFDNYASIATIQVSAVPVPAALPLLLSGIAGLGAFSRRRRNAT